MLDIKQLIVFLKTEIQKTNNNTFYLEIDKKYKDIYPVIVFNLDYNLINEQRINATLNINVYANKFNNILELEQISQDLFNFFSYYRIYAEKNMVNFSIITTQINIENTPTQEENLKRKTITVEMQVQFK